MRRDSAPPQNKNKPGAYMALWAEIPNLPVPDSRAQKRECGTEALSVPHLVKII
jgi:hypothetical protein